MGITEYFVDHTAAFDLDVTSKEALLRALATTAAARLSQQESAIFEALQDRERLGSTALGRGVALPHAQLAQTDNPALFFARLAQPIDFDAKDGEPVDLVFLVLWPAAAPEGFLPALAEICRVLREPKLLRQLRGAASAVEALSLLRDVGPDTRDGIHSSGTDAR